MSYEGYDQILCKSGHYSVEDCYEFYHYKEGEDHLWRCPICGELAAWVNSVDQTNGTYCPAWNSEKQKCEAEVPLIYYELYDEDDYDPFCPEDIQKECQKSNGRIDGYIELEILEEEKYSEPCEKCGCKKLLNHTTYKVPEKGGHRVP